MSVGGFEIPLNVVILGLVSGLAYALVATGLVLVYRATKVINFAQGEMGAFGASVLAKLVLDLDWIFVPALMLVVAVGGLIGATVELTVVRRLFFAPRPILMVATIGVAQVLFFAQLALPEINSIAPYPVAIDRALTIGNLRLGGEHFLVLAAAPAVIVGLTIFLNRTPWGLAIRSAADNPDSARLVGINPKQVSTMVWVIAGAFATLGAVMLAPIRGVVVGIPALALGPGLLLRAVTAAMIGRLESLTLTLAGALGIGVVESMLLHNYSTEPGLPDAVLGVAVLAIVLFRRPARDRDESWSFTKPLRPVPARLRRIRWVRSMPVLATTAALLAAIALPIVVTSSSRTFLFASALIFALIGLSITLLTGWAGLLSFGQFAFVGLGALTTGRLVDLGMAFGPAVLVGVAVGVVVAIVVGIPALRVRGVYLAIVTLALAVAASGWLFHRPFWFGGRLTVRVPRGQLGPVDLSSQRAYYYLCLAVLVVAIALVVRIRRSPLGRSIIAVRDNEPGARAFGLAPARAKLTAFATSGGLAALAGGLWAGLNVSIDGNAFPAEESLRVVAMTIIGGLGSVVGAVLGALYVVGLPAIFGETAEIELLTSGAGLLVLLMYFPDGLAGVVYAGRDALLRVADRHVPPRHDAGRVRSLPRPVRAAAAPAPAVPLRVSGVSVAFGGRVALEDVSLEARRGETVGLIGANGAGKSTLLDVIGGFVAPHSGTVELLGTDVGHWPAHRRAALGLARVFQHARLFTTLTVGESIEVALDGPRGTSLVEPLVGACSAASPARRHRAEASEWIGYFGLGRYADNFVNELSTGTRRIVEMACLLARDARVLALDEPTAGLAQRETEAFGPLITRVRDELDATVLIVEHDMPLVMSVSDRIYCLDAGTVIAEDEPNAVRSDPAVIAAYLGTDERAIVRSDALPGTRGGRS